MENGPLDIQVYIQDSSRFEWDQLRKEVERQDGEGIQNAAHRLKGAMLALGADAASMAAEIEELAQSGKLTARREQCAESSPAWSPDGARIAIWSYCLGIATIPTDGSGDTRTVFNGSLVSGYTSLSWSPDGTYVAFTRGERSGSRMPTGSTPRAGSARPASSVGIQLGRRTRHAAQRHARELNACDATLPIGH
jgi:hypothetical protein